MSPLRQPLPLSLSTQTYQDSLKSIKISKKLNHFVCTNSINISILTHVMLVEENYSRSCALIVSHYKCTLLTSYCIQWHISRSRKFVSNLSLATIYFIDCGCMGACDYLFYFSHTLTFIPPHRSVSKKFQHSLCDIYFRTNNISSKLSLRICRQ